MNTNELILILEDLTKSYRQLLELVRSEKKILIDANILQMNECQFQKEIILQKINQSDLKRQSFAREICHELKINADEPRLLDIAKHLEGQVSDKLRSQHAALELIIKRLSEINFQNAQIAQLALKNVNGALNNLKETYMGRKTYQNKGQIQNGSDRSGHLVSREA